MTNLIADSLVGFGSAVLTTIATGGLSLSAQATLTGIMGSLGLGLSWATQKIFGSDYGHADQIINITYTELPNTRTKINSNVQRQTRRIPE